MNTRNNMRFGSKSSSYTPQQGDVLLVDFGGKGKAGRNLAGCRPVYVVSSQTDGNHRGLVWAIPLFREISRDCDGQNIKIELNLYFFEFEILKSLLLTAIVIK